MNINALSSKTMLAHSHAWLNTPALRDAFAAYPLSASVLEQMQVVHDYLAAKQNTRAHVEARLVQLTEEADSKDRRHDRKVRAIHFILQGLVEGLDDEALAQKLQDLQTQLVPDGLRTVQRSYLDEAGAVIELQQRVTPDMLAYMGKIKVGPVTLADLYRDLIAAGEDLGRTVRERAELQASVSRAGTLAVDIDSRGARHRWIRTASMLLEVLELLTFPAALREKIRAPLARSIQEATRARGGTDIPAPDDGIDDAIDDNIDDGIDDIDTGIDDGLAATPGDGGDFDVPAGDDDAVLAGDTFDALPLAADGGKPDRARDQLDA